MNYNLIHLRDELDNVATVMTSESTKAILKKLIGEVLRIEKKFDDHRDRFDAHDDFD